MTNEAPAGTPEPIVTPTPATPAAAKTGTAKIVTPILALVAALAIGLFAGVLIGHSTAQTTASARGGLGAGGFGGGGGNQTQGGAGAQGGFGAGGFGGMTAGTIVSISGSSIVLKEANGTTVTVNTTGSTTVTRNTKSTVTSLKAGETIRVSGANSGGTVTATTITEGKTAGGGFRPGGTPGSSNN